MVITNTQPHGFLVKWTKATRAVSTFVVLACLHHDAGLGTGFARGRTGPKPQQTKHQAVMGACLGACPQLAKSIDYFTIFSLDSLA